MFRSATMEVAVNGYERAWLMRQASGAMTWGEGAVALLTVGIIAFLLFV
jgi:hypothetical protein